MFKYIGKNPIETMKAVLTSVKAAFDIKETGHHEM